MSRVRYGLVSWKQVNALLKLLSEIFCYMSLPPLSVRLISIMVLTLVWLSSSFCAWDFLTKSYACKMAITFNCTWFNDTFNHSRLLKSCITFSRPVEFSFHIFSTEHREHSVYCVYLAWKARFPCYIKRGCCAGIHKSHVLVFPGDLILYSGTIYLWILRMEPVSYHLPGPRLSRWLVDFQKICWSLILGFQQQVVKINNSELRA